jgi:hypothetical protein
MFTLFHSLYLLDKPIVCGGPAMSLHNVQAIGGQFPSILRLFFLHFGSRFLCNKNSDQIFAISIHFCKLIDCEMCNQIFNSGSNFFYKLFATKSNFLENWLHIACAIALFFAKQLSTIGNPYYDYIGTCSLDVLWVHKT